MIRQRTTDSIIPEKFDEKTSGSILIVEDEEDLAALLEYNLKKAYYEVHVAGDGRIALQLAAEILPDVILLDILLPEMSGWEVCRRLREHTDREIASIPIVMLTALRDDRDKYRGLELGADIFIKKPYAIQEVLLHCRNLVRTRKRHLNLIRKCDSVLHGDKDDIYKILFHELKNQLTIIGGITGFLDRETGSDRGRKCIRAIRMSTDYLESIAREVWNLEQLCPQEALCATETISLKKLTAEVVALVSPLAFKKNIALQLTGPDSLYPCRLNKTAVKIILVILVENGLKYSPPNSSIKIKLEESKENIMAAVSDNGPGIALQEQLKIFDKGYRTSEARDTSSGTGMGLYLARKLADSMHCTLQVQSKPGEGSTFTCSFPSGQAMNCKEPASDDSTMHAHHRDSRSGNV